MPKQNSVYLSHCMVAMAGLQNREMGFEELRNVILKGSPNNSCSATKALTVIRQCTDNNWIVKKGKKGSRGKYALTEKGKLVLKSKE